MGKPSRDKGARRERQIVHRHVAIGIHAERVPLSGATHHRGNGGDVDIYPFPTTTGQRRSSVAVSGTRT